MPENTGTTIPIPQDNRLAEVEKPGTSHDDDALLAALVEQFGLVTRMPQKLIATVL